MIRKFPVWPRKRAGENASCGAAIKELMVSHPVRVRSLFGGARHSVGVIVVGCCVLVLLGDQATFAACLGSGDANSAPTNGSRTDEDEHMSRVEKAPAGKAARPSRRNGGLRHRSLASGLRPRPPALSSAVLSALAPAWSEHALRNSLGGPLRC
jgi:hypothetical protein